MDVRFAFALIILTACSSSGGSPTMASEPSDGSPGASGSSNGDAGSGAIDGATSTWTEVYSTIIGVQCVSCHAPGGIGVIEGKLDMSTQATAYTNLVGVMAAGAACAGKGARVTMGSPDTSVLFLKVSPAVASPCGAKMPLGGPALSDDQANRIGSWIAAGAANN